MCPPLFWRLCLAQCVHDAAGLECICVVPCVAGRRQGDVPASSTGTGTGTGTRGLSRAVGGCTSTVYTILMRTAATIRPYRRSHSQHVTRSPDSAQACSVVILTMSRFFAIYQGSVEIN